MIAGGQASPLSSHLLHNSIWSLVRILMAAELAWIRSQPCWGYEPSLLDQLSVRLAARLPPHPFFLCRFPKGPTSSYVSSWEPPSILTDNLVFLGSVALGAPLIISVSLWVVLYKFTDRISASVSVCLTGSLYSVRAVHGWNGSRDEHVGDPDANRRAE